MSALDQVVNKRPAVRRRLKVTPLDIAIIAGAISFIAYLLYRVDAYLVYHWDWGRLLQYFFYYDPDQDQWQSNLLVKGLLITAQTSLWAMLFAFVIGLVMGLCRISQVALFRMISRGYVEFVRNMPPVPFLFIMFFFVGNQLLKPLGLSDLAQEAPPIIQDLIIVLFGELNLLRNFSAAVLALALYEGAYITEIVRAGVLSIERGQWEAGDSLGLSRVSQLRYVILPQAVQRIAPPLANQFIQLIKDSALVSLISIQELTFMGNEIAVSTTRFFETWIIVAAMYFTVCYGLARLFARMERRMNKGRM